MVRPKKLSIGKESTRRQLAAVKMTISCIHANHRTGRKPINRFLWQSINSNIVRTREEQRKKESLAGWARQESLFFELLKSTIKLKSIILNHKQQLEILLKISNPPRYMLLLLFSPLQSVLVSIWMLFCVEFLFIYFFLNFFNKLVSHPQQQRTTNYSMEF